MKLSIDIASPLEASGLAASPEGGVKTGLKFFRPKSECNAIVLVVETEDGRVLDQVLVRVSGRDGKIRVADMRGQVTPAVEVAPKT